MQIKAYYKEEDYEVEVGQEESKTLNRALVNFVLFHNIAKKI